MSANPIDLHLVRKLVDELYSNCQFAADLSTGGYESKQPRDLYINETIIPLVKQIDAILNPENLTQHNPRKPINCFSAEANAILTALRNDLDRMFFVGPASWEEPSERVIAIEKNPPFLDWLERLYRSTFQLAHAPEFQAALNETPKTGNGSGREQFSTIADEEGLTKAEVIAFSEEKLPPNIKRSVDLFRSLVASESITNGKKRDYYIRELKARKSIVLRALWWLESRGEYRVSDDAGSQEE